MDRRGLRTSLTIEEAFRRQNGLVISGGNGSPLLQLAKHALDAVAIPVAPIVGAFRRLEPVGQFARESGAITAVRLELLHPLQQSVRETAPLLGDRCDGCPAGRVLSFVLQHHAHRALADFRRKLVRCSAHYSAFSQIRASGKPGTLQSRGGSMCWAWAELWINIGVGAASGQNKLQPAQQGEQLRLPRSSRFGKNAAQLFPDSRYPHIEMFRRIVECHATEQQPRQPAFGNGHAKNVA